MYLVETDAAYCMSVSVKVLRFNSFVVNTYVVFNPKKECILIDPGCTTASEEDQLLNFLRTNQLTVKYLINTHVHLDHIFGNYLIKQAYRVPLVMHKEGLYLFKQSRTLQYFYGFNGYRETEPDIFVDQDDLVNVSDFTLKVIYVPGHAPGHIALYDKVSRTCFTGDVLFKGSVGRTDLWGGDAEQLYHSVNAKLFALPNDTIVYPGHGPSTTIGEAKVYLKGKL